VLQSAVPPLVQLHPRRPVAPPAQVAAGGAGRSSAGTLQGGRGRGAGARFRGCDAGMTQPWTVPPSSAPPVVIFLPSCRRVSPQVPWEIGKWRIEDTLVWGRGRSAAQIGRRTSRHCCAPTMGGVTHISLASEARRCQASVCCADRSAVEASGEGPGLIGTPALEVDRNRPRPGWYGA